MDILSKKIIEEWGISKKPEAEQSAEVLRLSKTIFQALLVRSLDILSVEEEEELDALLAVDFTTTEDVLKFLTSKIPTFDILIKEEREKIKKGLVLAG